MKSTLVPLLPGKAYHLFNHAVGIENLFREDRNYVFFLKKFRKYATPVCRTFSYALLPNHFHFLVQIRSLTEIGSLMPSGEGSPTAESCVVFVMQQFSNLFNGYAKAYNKLYNRKGALFIDYLRRKPIGDATYFQQTVLYHHFNAVKHGFCDTPLDYRFSSYPAFLSNLPSVLERETVIQQFGGQAAFIARHQGYDWRFDDDLDF
ncbi:MAG: transposase [Saprospiraceae bacterium]